MEILYPGKGQMKKDHPWIVCSQTKEDLGKYQGPACWVNKCLRCGEEEPVYAGRLDVSIFQTKSFGSLHGGCKEKGQPTVTVSELKGR